MHHAGMRHLALALLFVVGCGSTGAEPCSPCGDSGIACPGTVADCIQSGAGVCQTGGPGDLQLDADGTFHKQFGAYSQSGQWQLVDGVVILSVPVDYGPSVVGRIAVSQGVCQP